eukprot:CAMPEP_0172452634 /NCGR_PEP_ID=MMETSP1065-20121228/10235_1 /TAXON_ID=265537 /ORGANISM="Amphiprora paludosa, Strain CCMP125" /LENGTH=189 /DNA_ID=CAMNT_0013204719 /DNA_START=105 /DNA_END=674 /DNA_ORIENTATION=-
MKLFTLLAALLCSAAYGFAPVAPQSRSGVLKAVEIEVDSIGNNIKVKELLQKVESQQLLSKVAQSGLLSKAQEAGITLSKLEPLLELAASNPDILVLVEASGPEVLAILPSVVDLAPGALPILASAISISPSAISAAGVGALAAAGAAVVFIPDDSVATVAAQTLIVGLAVPAAGASFVGSAILGKLTK